MIWAGILAYPSFDLPSQYYYQWSETDHDFTQLYPF